MQTITNDTGAAKKEALNLYDAEQLTLLATHLQTFFKEQKLVSQIQDRDYVKVAGWQYAGTKLGIVPMVEEVADQSSEKEIRYQTRVALLNIHTNQYVGCGFGLCSNTEHKKQKNPAYAIQSLSQTRAIGKAYRNLLGWVIELAGFSSTPAEEMEGLPPEEEEKPVKAMPPANAEQLATVAKRRELLLALNHECISKQEREQMIMSIDKMNQKRCEEALTKVRAKIEDYEKTKV